MQKNQLAMKKPHSYSNRNKTYRGFFFVVEGSLEEENVQNLQVLLIRYVGTAFKYIFISRGAAFVLR